MAMPEEFIAYFKERLTSQVPSEVEFRAELPKSMIGKILRRALREEGIRKTNQAITVSLMFGQTFRVQFIYTDP